MISAPATGENWDPRRPDLLYLIFLSPQTSYTPFESLSRLTASLFNKSPDIKTNSAVFTNWGKLCKCELASSQIRADSSQTNSC